MKKVYRAINVTREEVYHGVTSKSVQERKEEGHCNGRTKTISHWDCENDKIIWKEVSRHREMSTASQNAHRLENEYKHHNGFENLNTRGL